MTLLVFYWKITWSDGGTEVGCDNVEFGWGDGAALPGDPTEGTGIESPIEFLEYDEPPPCGVPGVVFDLRKENVERLNMCILFFCFV